MKLSVIVPVYNVEKYVCRCLKSLVHQLVDDYEIIVVDDGTEDRSIEYAIKMQMKYTHIKIIHQENGGLSSARNTGIACATGEYLLFCDSDDEIKENCLTILYEEAKSKDLDMLLFDAQTIYEDGTIIEHENDFYNRPSISEETCTGLDLLKELYQKGGYLASACLYLIKREMINRNNLSFYEGIIHEDELFTPIALTIANRVEHRNWQFYNRYIRAGSITNGMDDKVKMEGIAVVIKELCAFYEKTQMSENYKKILKEIILSHIRNFLGCVSWMKKPDKNLQHEKQRIEEITRKNHWRLGVKFWLYIYSIHMRKLCQNSRID